MSNRLNEINQLLPDNEEGLITEAKMREAFKKTFDEIGEKLDRSDVASMIQGAVVGSSNLVLKSNEAVFTSDAFIKGYSLVSPLKQGQYTLTIKGNFQANNKPKPQINKVDIDPNGQGSLSNGVYKYTFNYNPSFGDSTQLDIYKRVNDSNVVNIEWIKLEKGNKATEWTPAIEDLTNQINQLKLGNMVYQDSFSSEKSGVTLSENKSGGYIKINDKNWNAKVSIEYVGNIKNLYLSLSVKVIALNGLKYQLEFFPGDNATPKSSPVLTGTGKPQIVKIENVFSGEETFFGKLLFKSADNSNLGELVYQNIMIVIGSSASDTYTPAQESLLRGNFVKHIQYKGNYKDQFYKVLVADGQGNLGWINKNDLQ